MKKSGLSRKAFLKRGLALGAGFCALSVMPSCFLLNESEVLLGKVADIEGSLPQILTFNRKPVLVCELEGELTIISMVCTHKQCTVEYKAEDEQFFCGCHDGLYDKEGKVLDGPPPEPLKRFKLELRGEELWVLNEFV